VKYRTVTVVAILVAVVAAVGLNLISYRVTDGSSGITVFDGQEQVKPVPEYCIAAGDSIGQGLRGMPFTNLIDKDDCKGNDVSYPVSYLLNALVAFVGVGVLAAAYMAITRTKGNRV